MPSHIGTDIYLLNGEKLHVREPLPQVVASLDRSLRNGLPSKLVRFRRHTVADDTIDGYVRAEHVVRLEVVKAPA